MNRFRLVFLLAVSTVAFGIGCVPSTAYNGGIAMSYHPSSKAAAGERLVYSAVELKTDADDQLLRAEGGTYLGEFEVVGERAGAAYTGAGSGSSTLSGRVSLEAANRGATHFYAAASSVTNGVDANTATLYPTSTTRVRFVLYRLEAGDWDRLPKKLQPDAPVPSAIAAR